MMEDDVTYLSVLGRKMAYYLNHRVPFQFRSARFVVFKIEDYGGNGISRTILRTDDLNYLKVWLDCNGYCLGELESGCVEKEHGYSQRRYVLAMKGQRQKESL